MADRAHPIPEAAPKDIEAIFALRKRTWLERTIGPEWYRLVHGVFTNPLSVTGLVIVGFFLLMALVLWLGLQIPPTVARLLEDAVRFLEGVP